MLQQGMDHHVPTLRPEFGGRSARQHGVGEDRNRGKALQLRRQRRAVEADEQNGVKHQDLTVRIGQMLRREQIEREFRAVQFHRIIREWLVVEVRQKREREGNENEVPQGEQGRFQCLVRRPLDALHRLGVPDAWHRGRIVRGVMPQRGLNCRRGWRFVHGLDDAKADDGGKGAGRHLDDLVADVEDFQSEVAGVGCDWEDDAPAQELGRDAILAACLPRLDDEGVDDGTEQALEPRLEADQSTQLKPELPFRHQQPKGAVEAWQFERHGRLTVVEYELVVEDALDRLQHSRHDGVHGRVGVE
mmetsp:Transcript_14496/g.39956  ORF Transcript_14496/g.39956 Transcript_14496/m.39956 type:complete len:303 (+) Transcript_14496:1528-2436(+)